MPSLPKHLRPRWRYLALELESWMDSEIEQASLQRVLWESTRTLLGDIESADLGLNVLRYSFEAGRGEAIVRVRRDTVERARAVIATVDTIDETPVRLGIRGVSGSVKACEENYLGIDRQAVTHEIVTLETVEGAATVRGDAVDLEVDTTNVGATNLDLT